jgi:putative ABC transport system permease protein
MGPGFVLGEIMGVVGDDRIRGLDIPVEGAVYAPIGAPNPPSVRSVHVVVRSSANAKDLAPLLRREVGALDPELPLVDVRSMLEVISGSYAVSRTSFAMLLFAISAFVALVLGAVGIFGVVAYSVSRRTSEIGVRVALGATAADIVARVLAVGMIPAALGVAVGLTIAAFGGGWISSLLFQTSTLDVSTFIAGPTALLFAAAIACIGPTLRAIRVDPVKALRSE